jgi:pimeloyl-ACP methyl ester carboxylesterase
VSSSYRSISAAVDGGRLHGGEWNQFGATTVVAVHGITANHHNFALLAEALPKTGCWLRIFGVGELAAACRGHGGSIGTPRTSPN